MTPDLDGGLALDEVAALRPSLRGSIHRWATPVAVLLSMALVARPHDGADRFVLGVYGICVTSMLAVSATYHSGRLQHRARRALRRLDHCTILLCIAGSYTATIWFALDGATRAWMLVATWTIATLGIILRLLWMHAPPWCISAVYLAAGWQVLLDLPAFARGTSDYQLALLVLGGTLYTVGGIVYALRRPDPWPSRFGYHEVFHALVVGGALAHYGAIMSLSAGA